METFFDKIQNFHYVVQRNWEGLPEEPGDDVDLFVSEEDFMPLLKLSKEIKNVKIDVRCPSDNYYPPKISRKLLENRRWWKAFYIPSKEAYFLALYYHAKVHKNSNEYDTELKKVFLDWINPTKPIDKGVGYHI